MGGRQEERKQESNRQNRGRGGDDEIISVGMCSAPEGQIVLRL